MLSKSAICHLRHAYSRHGWTIEQDRQNSGVHCLMCFYLYHIYANIMTFQGHRGVKVMHALCAATYFAKILGSLRYIVFMYVPLSPWRFIGCSLPRVLLLVPHLRQYHDHDLSRSSWVKVIHALCAATYFAKPNKILGSLIVFQYVPLSPRRFTKVILGSRWDKHDRTPIMERTGCRAKWAIFRLHSLLCACIMPAPGSSKHHV